MAVWSASVLCGVSVAHLWMKMKFSGNIRPLRRFAGVFVFFLTSRSPPRTESKLFVIVNWCFEPSQPQWITSGQNRRANNGGADTGKWWMTWRRVLR